MKKRAARLSEGNARQILDYKIEYEGKTHVDAILTSPSSELQEVCCFPCSKTLANTKTDNRIIFGQNVRALNALRNDDAVCGNVRLVYIDPPFGTGSRMESRDQEHAYDDTQSGSDFLEFMRHRLVLLYELLANDGSIYVHLDDKMVFPVKLLMDEIFGIRNFRNFITRRKSNKKNFTSKRYGNIADYILFYSKTKSFVWNRPYEPWTDVCPPKEYRYTEEETSRKYMKVPIHAPGVRNGETGQPWRGVKPPPGKHWQVPPSKLDELDAEGKIYWSPSGNPRRKVYLDESRGIPIQNIWMDFRDAHNQNMKTTGYPTEKNLDLLTRIIETSSNEGDLVLDCFMGSGTTLVASELLGRSWIGIDNSRVAIETTLKRFANGSEPMGDFVNGKRKSEPRLFSNAVLGTGVRVFVGNECKPSSPTPKNIESWQKLLSSIRL